MTLWLVRHAATLAAAGVCYGRLDVEADATDTSRAAQELASTLPAGILLRSSPARRCRQLSDALAALRPDLAQPTLDARLQEMDFGAWEGRTWDAIGEPEITAWTSDFARYEPGGGESVHALLARVAGAFDEARARGQATAWITHAGVVRATRLLAGGVRTVTAASQWPRDDVPFGGWETVELA